MLQMKQRFARLIIPAVLACIACGCKPQTGGVPYGDGDRLREAIDNDDLPALKRLLAGGADPSSRYYYDPSSWTTPLHWAVENGSTGAMKILIEAGAQPNAVDSAGDTAAVGCHELSSLKLLHDHGASFDRSNHEGDCILHWPNVPAECVQFLVSHGADITARDMLGSTPLHVRCEYYYFDEDDEARNESEIEVMLLLATPEILHATNHDNATPVDLLRRAGMKNDQLEQFVLAVERGNITRPPEPE